MTEVHSFGVEPITCHAWNKERSQVAFSPNSHEVNIYKRVNDRWNSVECLSQHGLRVTSIDWAPQSNRIVTCAADRNAYVWTQVGSQWKPTLVLLRINRAATCVRWSPKENKFAVGSGARLISVCYFEQENDWWVSKHIKKPIRSTVTTLDWHPNNLILACGSTDFNCRVFAADIGEMEEKLEPTVWGTKTSPNQLLQEFTNNSEGSGGWVHCVSFSGSGNQLAWVGHDSSITVVDAARGLAKVSLKTEFLPFLTCTWISENSIIAAGHGCCPMLCCYDGQKKLSIVSKIDNTQKKESAGLSAMRKFQSLDKRATTDHNDSMDTIHQNAITQVSIFSGTKANATKVCTTAVDGQLVIWNLKGIESGMANLKLT
uniref:Actin-related protein 2/3 complex subunit n=1 Tax=Strigamia maritima TaxID=126957 RepID=T1JHP8_STRMM